MGEINSFLRKDHPHLAMTLNISHRNVLDLVHILFNSENPNWMLAGFFANGSTFYHITVVFLRYRAEEGY